MNAWKAIVNSKTGEAGLASHLNRNGYALLNLMRFFSASLGIERL
jgi:hypothetical protein